MAEETKTMWEGKASVKVRGRRAEQVWPLLQDFCNFHKWLPSIDTCYTVQGVHGQPGLIRYCGSTVSSSDGNDDKPITMWCHEKLLEIDPMERRLSYEIVDNNMGFKLYKARFEVLPMDCPDDEGSCEIKWLFVAEPVEWGRYEDLMSYIQSSLQGMAERMEKALQS